MVIDGIGGMGKTALALEVAHAARQQAMFDGYAFASAKTTWLTPEGVREETLALHSLDAFARTFALALGLDEIARMPDADARAGALLGALRGQRALLIWDNLETLIAEERDRIAEFLRRLPAPNKAIVTSRRRTGESALTVRLDRLSFGEAKQLVAGVATRQPRVAQELRHAGEPMLRRLYEAAGGNPLALHWTLGFVAQKGQTLGQALQRLEQAARGSDLYAFLFADAVRDLSEGDKQVLVALTTFRSPATAPALADATGMSQNAVELALEALVTLSLVNDLRAGNFTLHPLVRTFVQQALGVPDSPRPGAVPLPALDPAARRSALRHWVEVAEQHGGEGKEAYKKFDRLDAAWPDLEGAAGTLREMAGVPGPTLRDEEAARLLVRLMDALRQYLWFRGLWSERVQIGEWAYDAARALGAWRDAGWAAYDVAWIHYNRADTARAETWAERMAEAMQRGGARRDRAIATRLRGLIAEQRGDLPEAERRLPRRWPTFARRSMKPPRPSCSTTWAAWRGRRRGMSAQRDTIARHWRLTERRGNKEGESSFSVNLGRLALDRGRPAEARPWFERALRLAREVGRQDLVADAQWGLARVLEEEEKFAEALPLAEEALRVRERLGHMNIGSARELVERLREKGAGER